MIPWLGRGVARGRFGMGVCPFLGLVCDATGASQASAI